MSSRLLILGWHNIDPTPAFPAPEGAGRRGFERQLALLARHANVIRLSTALDLMEAGEPLPPRSVVLTFDDGYRDAVSLAVPALARAALAATFFLVPGFLSGRLRPWWEDLAAAFDEASVGELRWHGEQHVLATTTERRRAHDCVLPALKRLDHAARAGAVAQLRDRLVGGRPATEEYFVDWDGAHALVAAGHEIGSHTMRHVILSREAPEEQARELSESRAELATRLGTPVDTFAYPNGTFHDYDEGTIDHLRSAGYRCGLTTRMGLATRQGSPYEMRRGVIGPTTDGRSVLRHLAWAARDRCRATVTFGRS